MTINLQELPEEIKGHLNYLIRYVASGRAEAVINKLTHLKQALAHYNENQPAQAYDLKDLLNINMGQGTRSYNDIDSGGDLTLLEYAQIMLRSDNGTMAALRKEGAYETFSTSWVPGFWNNGYAAVEAAEHYVNSAMPKA